MKVKQIEKVPAADRRKKDFQILKEEPITGVPYNVFRYTEIDSLDGSNTITHVTTGCCLLTFLKEDKQAVFTAVRSWWRSLTIEQRTFFHQLKYPEDLKKRKDIKRSKELKDFHKAWSYS